MLESLDADVTHFCTQCSYQSEWPFQLNHHIQMKHGSINPSPLFCALVQPELYYCVCCRYKSYFKLTRHEHCTHQHDVRSDEQKSVENFQCNGKLKEHSYHNSTAQLFLINKNSYSKKPSHRTEETTCAKIESEPPIDSRQSIKRFNCAFCSLKTREKATMQRHLLTHAADDEITWFHCATCSYRGKSKIALRGHKCKHAAADDINWMCCTYCSYRAKRKSCLTRHNMLKHAAPEQIDWFHCTKCSYRSGEKSKTTRHMLTHAAAEEIAWYACTRCSYRAKQSHHLKRHMLRHVVGDEVAWFSCSECSYRSKVKDTLNRHMRTHGDGAPCFECGKCSYRGKSLVNLKRHMLKKHAAS